MAKITNYIPEPQEKYDVNNQRQILESLDSMKQQLNFSFQQDLKNEQDAFNYFLSGLRVGGQQYRVQVLVRQGDDLFFFGIPFILSSINLFFYRFC